MTLHDERSLAREASAAPAATFKQRNRKSGSWYVSARSDSLVQRHGFSHKPARVFRDFNSLRGEQTLWIARFVPGW